MKEAEAGRGHARRSRRSGVSIVLQSTNEAFARSAIDAVKRWKYAPIGYEAILTVTVNFTLT